MHTYTHTYIYVIKLIKDLSRMRWIRPPINSYASQHTYKYIVIHARLLGLKEEEMEKSRTGAF